MLVKPVCVKCQRFYRPFQNGHYMMEQMPVTRFAAPGTATPDQWQPYKLWRGDLWRCEGCGHQIVVGILAGPVAEHFQPGFHDVVAQATESNGRAPYPRIPLTVVNDC